MQDQYLAVCNDSATLPTVWVCLLCRSGLLSNIPSAELHTKLEAPSGGWGQSCTTHMLLHCGYILTHGCGCQPPCAHAAHAAVANHPVQMLRMMPS